MVAKLKNILSVAVLVFAFAVLVPGTVSAADDCARKGEKTSFDWGPDCATVGDLVSMVFKIMASLVGIAVVVGIAWGGMLYTTSNGNASKAQQGITTIVNAVIGLLLFIFMFAITNFIVPGGILK